MNQDGSLSPKRRPESLVNESETFIRHNYRKLFSAGVDKWRLQEGKYPIVVTW
jgi:hypothetical protein